MTSQFTTRNDRFDNFTVTAVQAGAGLHADGFDHDDGDQFMSVAAHGVTKVDARNGQSTKSVTLTARIEDGRTLTVHLFGINLDVLRAALDAAEVTA